MISANFVFLAVFISLFGSGTYAYSTLKGHTRPNQVTWILWALAPLIAFAAELDQHVGVRSLMTFVVGFGPLLVVLASLVSRETFWHVSRLDLACGALSVIALGLWLATRKGDVAIAFSIASDLLAAVPTIIKAYHDPETEHHAAFRNGALSAAITLFTVKSWTFANYGFPLYILCNGVLLYALIRFQLGVHLSRRTPTSPTA